MDKLRQFLLELDPIDCQGCKYNPCPEGLPKLLCVIEVGAIIAYLALEGYGTFEDGKFTKLEVKE